MGAVNSFTGLPRHKCSWIGFLKFVDPGLAGPASNVLNLTSAVIKAFCLAWVSSLFSSSVMPPWSWLLRAAVLWRRKACRVTGAHSHLDRENMVVLDGKEAVNFYGGVCAGGPGWVIQMGGNLDITSTGWDWFGWFCGKWEIATFLVWFGCFVFGWVGVEITGGVRMVGTSSYTEEDDQVGLVYATFLFFLLKNIFFKSI